MVPVAEKNIINPISHMTIGSTDKKANFLVVKFYLNSFLYLVYNNIHTIYISYNRLLFYKKGGKI